jgi:hypothetical protein
LYEEKTRLFGVELLYQIANFGNVEEVVRIVQLIVGLDAFVDVLAFQVDETGTVGGLPVRTRPGE